MKILQMISKNDRYGAQRIFLDQVAALRLLGHEVIVVARGAEGYVADSVRAMNDVPYYGIPLKGARDLLFLRHLIRENSIDVVHSTLDRADYFGIFASKLTRCPVVSTMMVPRVHHGYRFMKRIGVLSRMQRDILMKHRIPAEKITLLRPGIDVDRFRSPDPVRRQGWKTNLRADSFSVVFCHISSMLPRKAHDISIALTAACKGRGENPLLVVIGDPLTGSYYDQLLKSIWDAGLTANVVFTGWTADVPEILSLSHFTVLPSENEALGVVLMEGMAAGTPVIAREAEGGAELVEDYESGFLYRPAEGVEPLAEKIVQLLHDEPRYAKLREHCRETAHREFSMERFGKRLLSLYQR
ncbi:MAG: glycosyltransferase family 4 protein [Nitrospiraceae bacterium]|nr:glycosyltransferase family 4 protein [Nitrospiraceae bacterium]